MSLNSPLRDKRIGIRLALTGGNRMLRQAEFGGTRHDNRLRTKEWRNRIATIPIEARVRPVASGCRPGYVPIPRCRSLVPIY